MSATGGPAPMVQIDSLPTAEEVSDGFDGPLPKFAPNTHQVSIKFSVNFLAGQDPTCATMSFDKLIPHMRVVVPEDGMSAIGLRFNPKGTLPVSLRVLAATVGAANDITSHFTVKLTDKGGKPIQSSHPLFVASSDTACHKSDGGFPLHLLRQHTAAESSTAALEEPPNLLDDHKHYWHVSIADLTRGVNQYPVGTH